MEKINYLALGLLSILLASCLGVSNERGLKSGVVKNPVSVRIIQISGEQRQYLSLDLGGSQKDTIIFYFTGSGCHDISNLVYPLYGKLPVNGKLVALLKKGVRPNSKGTTCSDEFVNNDNLDNLVNDSVVLINHFLQQRRHKNIVVAGHSEGGDIVWRLVEKVPRITHVYSMHRGLGMNNLDELSVIARSKMSQQRETYLRLIADLEGKSDYYRDDDFILIRKKASWLISVRDKRNPAEVLLKSGKKVLLMMGDKDKHVPIRSMYAANKVFCDRSSKKLTAIVKKGYGHSIDVGTQSRAAELDILARWINGEMIKVPHPFQRLGCAR